jgi:hypothetical protein
MKPVEIVLRSEGDEAQRQRGVNVTKAHYKHIWKWHKFTSATNIC